MNDMFAQMAQESLQKQKGDGNEAGDAVAGSDATAGGAEAPPPVEPKPIPSLLGSFAPLVLGGPPERRGPPPLQEFNEPPPPPSLLRQPVPLLDLNDLEPPARRPDFAGSDGERPPPALVTGSEENPQVLDDSSEDNAAGRAMLDSSVEMSEEPSAEQQQQQFDMPGSPPAPPPVVTSSPPPVRGGEEGAEELPHMMEPAEATGSSVGGADLMPMPPDQRDDAACDAQLDADETATRGGDMGLPLGVEEDAGGTTLQPVDTTEAACPDNTHALPQPEMTSFEPEPEVSMPSYNDQSRSHSESMDSSSFEPAPMLNEFNEKDERFPTQEDAMIMDDSFDVEPQAQGVIEPQQDADFEASPPNFNNVGDNGEADRAEDFPQGLDDEFPLQQQEQQQQEQLQEDDDFLFPEENQALQQLQEPPTLQAQEEEEDENAPLFDAPPVVIPAAAKDPASAPQHAFDDEELMRTEASEPNGETNDDEAQDG